LNPPSNQGLTNRKSQGLCLFLGAALFVYFIRNSKTVSIQISFYGFGSIAKYTVKAEIKTISNISKMHPVNSPFARIEQNKY